MTYPKRLIEVDLPIFRISAHARREKSIRHGHISTLHIWWARRPLAACRAVICAALWPDPADPLCPPAFREAAVQALAAFARRVNPERITQESRQLQETVSVESRGRWEALAAGTLTLDLADETTGFMLRMCLLDFIADFANWDNSTVPAYLETSRTLTQAAHEALGGAPGTRPLVVDPFAGGGSIPLEALRVGADAFASDLNPVAVLLNKVTLEYIPKYGNAEIKIQTAEGEEVTFRGLAEAVRYWGNWVKEQAEKDLATFYPEDPDGGTPIAYLWARTILSESPGQGDVAVEVPLIRSLWLCKKPNRKMALRWVRNEQGVVQTDIMDVKYADGMTRKVRRPRLEIFEPKTESEVEPGTVARGSATCSVTGYTTPVVSVRNQLKSRRGGAEDARLLAIVSTRDSETGRKFRLPTVEDLLATHQAAEILHSRQEHSLRQSGMSDVPDEVISSNELRRISVPIYGMERWGDLFAPRQALFLSTIASLVRKLPDRLDIQHCSNNVEEGALAAVQTILGCFVDRECEHLNSLGRWNASGEKLQHSFGRQAIGMVWDFCEGNPFGGSVGSCEALLECVLIPFETASVLTHEGTIAHSTATANKLPDDSADEIITDPPYYDAVPYAYLSDFFYVWLKRSLGGVHVSLLQPKEVPKAEEIVVDRPHRLSNSNKGIAFYENELLKAFSDSRRVLRPNGLGIIVFASKTTASWEAILKAVIDAGWVITGSWPIDTEMENRVAAQGQARLASSIHLVCRPRENSDGTNIDSVGEWRDVLGELPKRIHEWMPRLTAEGVVGADAIFACLGPALEIFSRYSRVEKANGDPASLREYLEFVWAAVSTEALSLIFKDANAAGLEPDARLTAMWLWTLGGAKDEGGRMKDESEEDAESEADDEEGASGSADKGKSSGGFTLEFDAARKIAQGLGVHLEQCTSLVEVKGDKARLLPVAERTAHLFGKGTEAAPSAKGRRKTVKQRSLFEELGEAEAAEAGWTAVKGPPPGTTVLDRVHQAMILFAANRGELLKRFLVEEGVGQDPRFWKLADNLNKLYPSGTEERRWVEGVLARKKGLGL